MYTEMYSIVTVNQAKNLLKLLGNKQGQTLARLTSDLCGTCQLALYAAVPEWQVTTSPSPSSPFCLWVAQLTIDHPYLLCLRLCDVSLVCLS